MKTKDLRQKSADELKVLLKEQQVKVRDFGFKIYQKQLKNIKQMKEAKKNIARILTILQENK